MTYVPQPQLGRTTTISWTATGGSLVAFLSLVSVTPPGNSVGEAETTLLASLFKPFLPTIPEAEGSFKVQHWDGNAGCVAMQAAVATAPVPTGVFLITFPSGGTISCPGFPKGYAIGETTNEEIITADIAFRQTGVATYTPPA
jgi:hypothetical protein